MPPRKDMSVLIGRTFNRLTITNVSPPTKKGKRFAHCNCVCGNNKLIELWSVTAGVVKSCGCYQREMGAIQGIKNIKHGYCRRLEPRKAEHAIWNMIVQRCTNKKNKQWRDYGGRGIKVCRRWRYSFALFIKDVGPRPTNRHSIERIDNNSHYMPSNCRWALPKEQARNKRNNLIIEYMGRKQTASAWAEEYGLPSYIVSSRWRLGWSVKRILNTPVQRQVKKKGGEAHEC